MQASPAARPTLGEAVAPSADFRASAWAVPVALTAVTLAGCWVRAAWLPSVQGTLGRDEARLALAARGILQHGIPVLPDGFLYTRGPLPAYLEALSLAIFGVTDQAARLPSLVFGTLLVPAVYVLGRTTGGPWAALAAATIVAFAQPLVLQAREAWLYSSLLLWFVLALAWIGRDGPGDRHRGGVAAVAALLSHELAVLLLPVAATLDVIRVLHGGRPFVRRRLAGFWLILLVGVGVVGALSLALRSPTAGGATVEMREYLRPSFDPRGLGIPLAILAGWHAGLLPVAALGLPFTRSGLRRIVATPGRLAAPFAVIAVLLFNAFELVQRGESRYVLPAFPPLAALATGALARVGPLVVAGLASAHLGRRARLVTRAVLLVALVAVGLDPDRLAADARARDVPSTWVQAVADRRPSDLIVSFAPTLTTHYLGRTDVWLRSEGYEKYVWAGQPPLRDIHSGALVVRDLRELDSLLLQPRRGRTAWVILAGDPAREVSPRAREVATALLARAAEVRRPPDGRIVLRVPL